MSYSTTICLENEINAHEMIIKVVTYVGHHGHQTTLYLDLQVLFNQTLFHEERIYLWVFAAFESTLRMGWGWLYKPKVKVGLRFYSVVSSAERHQPTVNFTHNSACLQIQKAVLQASLVTTWSSMCHFTYLGAHIPHWHVDLSTVHSENWIKLRTLQSEIRLDRHEDVGCTQTRYYHFVSNQFTDIGL